MALLNFPLTTLTERLAEGTRWDRKRWAQVRLAGRFARRVPGEVQQAIATAGSAAEIYIAQYNVWMHHLVDDKGERLFPKGLRLITHWNLRDELKADYSDPSGKGLAKQRTILKVMERIVTQTIPASVIDNPRLDWNPFTNAVSAAPAAEIEPDAPAARSDKVAAARPDGSEPDTRYLRLLDQFRAARRADPFSPVAPTAIARSFELQREIPEERVTAMLRQILESKHVPRVAALIEKKLGRKLEPQDIWFNGFQARGKFAEADLDAITRKRYPTAEAFAKEIPAILGKLGFDKQKADFLASHIVVDPSRGAGHALQAARRGDFPHLRTRVEKDGMNYKGYNIAVHELGHNVEQVFSLYEVDHTLLAGVPNNAFTEALAFVFQAKDLELLGLAKPDAESERMRVLNDFWQTWEIAGVALVDIAVWHWMYDHPDAKPAELRDAVVAIAREHWNRYYAPVLGGKDSPQLGIYSAHDRVPDVPLRLRDRSHDRVPDRGEDEEGGGSRGPGVRAHGALRLGHTGPVDGERHRGARRGRAAAAGHGSGAVGALRRSADVHHPSRNVWVLSARRVSLASRWDGGEHFDAIVCDLMMPEMTGMDLHAALSIADSAAARSMVFITGGAFTPRAREFLASIDNPRLEKPFDFEVLRRAIRDLVGPRGLPDGASLTSGDNGGSFSRCSSAWSCPATTRRSRSRRCCRRSTPRSPSCTPRATRWR